MMHALDVERNAPVERAGIRWPGSTAGVMGLALLCLMASPGPGWAQARFRPAPEQVVLPVSLHTLGAVSQDLKAAEQAWQGDPSNLKLALRFARQAFLLGVTEGDLRWYGSAKAALMPWWTQPSLSAEGHFMRGLVKQGFHDFRGGLADIDAAIALDATDAEFWSWRFALHLLAADMVAARADCDTMARRFEPNEARACQAILDYHTGQAAQAVKALRVLVDAPGFQGHLAQDWLRFHLGEALRTAGHYEQAVATWSAHLSKRPRAHSVRLALAELLNDLGRHTEARRWASVPAPTDALLMQQFLASQALKDADAPRLAQQVEERMQAQTLRQDALIERPRLLYLIRHGKDLSAGLALAQENWALQKEPPDAVLLIEAALKSDRPQAARPVLDWMEQTRYTDPALAHLASELRRQLGR